MKRKIVGLILILLSTFIFSKIAMAATDTVTINVNISTYAQIEVNPSTATFNNVQPGAISFPNSLGFAITNTGSTNFTDIYTSMNTHSTETMNPVGTGNSKNYYAGGFVVLMNETMLDAGSDEWRFVGRLEWNLTEPPENYKRSDADWSVAWGYFGNNSYQYVWDLSNGTDGTCNSTGTQVTIKTWAVNGSTEAYDLSTGVSTITISPGGDSWAAGPDSTAGSPLNGYCVAANSSCDRIYIYQWDWSTTFPACNNRWYLYHNTTAADAFKPLDQVKFNITVWVPKGIPAGDTSQSTMTITAE